MQTQTTDAKIIGVVYKKTLGHYDVHHGDKITPCALSSKLWKDFKPSKDSGKTHEHRQNVTEKHMDPVAIGDRVRFTLAGDGSGMIWNVLPRRNYLARASAKPMPGAHAFEQIIAANLDQVIPVFAAADPEPKWHLLDRYLVTAEYYNLPSLIIITKTDLVRGSRSEKELSTAVQRYRTIGYPVILTSALENKVIFATREALAGRTSVLMGKSGVGKSTLLNALEPGLGVRVQAVNQTTGKGRHTTTHLEMFQLASGGGLIGTPGVREFGLWEVSPKDIAYCYPEMQPYIGQCKFGMSCQHNDEPGCAIRQVVMDGKISPYRYQSYLRLKADL